MHSNDSLVMIAAGGTGGHVFPALAVAEQLRDQQVSVIWVGTERGIEKRVVPAADIELHTVPIAGVRGKNIVAWLVAPFLVMRSVFQLIGLIRRQQVAVVLGMGGYVSFAAGLAAVLARKPLVIQEQNAIAGSANRLLAPFARRIFTGFDGVLSQYRQAEWSGNPLRKVFTTKRDVVYPSKSASQIESLTLVVIGGSLGARVLNTVVPEAVNLWRSTSSENFSLKVVHQTGETDCQRVSEIYRQYDIDANVLPFIDDVYQTYASADLLIARAGALTVSEIAAMAVASILVPYPHAIDDHQTANARHLADGGAAVLMPQNEFTAKNLSQQLEVLMSNDIQRANMADSAGRLGKLNATERVANACKELCYA